MITITPEIKFPGLIHLHFETQYGLASTLMRLQEFYESPYEGIRGHVFTHETFMDRYAQENDGEFTYFEDWTGFNVPGHIVDAFFEQFTDLQQKEHKLRKFINEILEENDWNAYYIIATCRGAADEEETVQHEIAHAMYYLFNTYKEEMDGHLTSMESEKALMKALKFQLKKSGYAENVHEDEMQAYFATSDMLFLHKYFKGLEIPWDAVLRCKLVFDNYYNKLVKNNGDDKGHC